MATYRKILKDKDGNNIIPALVGDGTEWVNTADIADGAVTPSKLENSDAYDKLVAIGGTEIASNSDLNTIQFCGVGIYVCTTTATVGTLSNCPTGAAFAMKVSQITSTTVRNPATDTWVYMVREITDIYGKVWRQRCYVEGTAGTVSYYAWYQVYTEQDGPFVKEQSVVLDGLTTTLTAQVKSLMSAGKDYGRFMCTYDGGSANISDKPTGNTDASFVCEAFCLRRYSSTDYRYRVICWVKEQDALYIAECTDNTSTLSWRQMQSTRILYNNSNGTAGDVPLADNASNYDYLEVYGVEDGGRKIFTKVLAPASGSKFTLFGLFSGVNNTKLYYRGATWEIANPDTTIAATTEKGTYQMSADGTAVSSGVNVKIRRVVGIKGGA